MADDDGSTLTGAPGARPGSRTLMLVGAALIGVISIGSGVVGLVRGDDPAACDRPTPTPTGTGATTTVALGARGDLGGLRVDVGGIADDGCSAHLGTEGGSPTWVGIGEGLAVDGGTLQVLGIERTGEGGTTGGAEVTLRLVAED